MSGNTKTIKIEIEKEMFQQFTGKTISNKKWNEFVDSGYFEIGEKTVEKLLKFVEEDLNTFIHDNPSDSK